MPYNSALNVLETSELLVLVFKYLENASNAFNAMVCRQWSEIALDLLWHDVQDMHRFLSIFAPLEATEDRSFRFVRKLQISDWETSERYRPRVKSLTYYPTGYKDIHSSALEELERFRMNVEVLPNLRTLHWNGPFKLSTIFMHQGIETFGITLIKPPYVGTFLEDVGGRMQNLVQLDLRFHFGISTIETSFTKLLSKLMNLQKLTLPYLCFTSEVVTATSHIQKLHSIRFPYHKRLGELQDVAEFNPVLQLQEGAYRTLNKLHIGTSFSNAMTFLGNLSAATNLTVLTIQSYPNIEKPGVFSNLTMAIADNFQCLVSLTLDSQFDSSRRRVAYQEENHINFDHLRPLLKCSRITSFIIAHPYPLHLELADIEKIAVTWPGLEYIDLNPEPYYRGDSTLTLEALLPFAHYCPEILMIGLFLNAVPPQLQSETDHLTYPCFRALEDLSIGASLIEDEIEVTSFLSLICPPECEVTGTNSYRGIYRWDDEILPVLDYRMDKWQIVQNWLPAMLDCKRRGMEQERSRWETKDPSNGMDISAR